MTKIKNGGGPHNITYSLGLILNKKKREDYEDGKNTTNVKWI